MFITYVNVLIIFQFLDPHMYTPTVSRFTLSYSASIAACQALGEQMATISQMTDAYNTGLWCCSIGWVEHQYMTLPNQQACGGYGGSHYKWPQSGSNLNIGRNTYCTGHKGELP